VQRQRCWSADRQPGLWLIAARHVMDPSFNQLCLEGVTEHQIPDHEIDFRQHVDSQAGALSPRSSHKDLLRRASSSQDRPLVGRRN
jgi:hypothetical protein